MLRMEIALILVLTFVGYMYFSAEKRHTLLHRIFSTLLVHLVFDAVTIYMVNHLETVSGWLNGMVHRLFIGTMVLVTYMLGLLDANKNVVVTTYRERAPEGIAARAFYKHLGFAEGALAEEFGSPVQEFVLYRSSRNLLRQ